MTPTTCPYFTRPAPGDTRTHEGAQLDARRYGTVEYPRTDDAMQHKPSMTMPTYTHGQRVRYLGPTDRENRVVYGGTYTVCGIYPQPPMKGVRPSTDLSIYVDDPHDDFGGVVSLPVGRFEPVEVESRSS